VDAEWVEAHTAELPMPTFGTPEEEIEYLRTRLAGQYVSTSRLLFLVLERPCVMLACVLADMRDITSTLRTALADFMGLGPSVFDPTLGCALRVAQSSGGMRGQSPVMS
jgi:hypothetical protein